MNLQLSDDQELLRKTFNDFFTRRCPLEVRRDAESHSGYHDGLWAEFAELGGHQIALPGDDPDASGTLVDAAFVAIEAGRALAPIPATETALAGRFLRLADPSAGASMLPVDATATLGSCAPGSLTENDRDRVTGEVPWTRSGAVAGHALIEAGHGLLLVDLSAAGVDRRPVPNLARFPMAALHFNDTPLVWMTVDRELRRRLRSEARVLHAAELVGAGRQALTLALDHVRERRQFDRPIASFQAIQHRLADRSTALDAAELLVIRAACAVDDPDALAYYSAVGLLTAYSASELAAKEALQFHGGYGFVTEYEIHRYLRFAKALGVLASDPLVLEDALPSSALPPRAPAQRRGTTGVDFLPSSACRRLYDEARRVFEGHTTVETTERVRTSGTVHDPELYRVLADRGWIGAAWPVECGGLGLSATEFGAIREAANYAGAPIDGQLVTELAGSAILAAGTAEQRSEFLPRILAGDLIIALGYTEPDSGSDVAAARTTATRVDGGYRIDGAKMFTTLAHVADYVFLLTRTDAATPKHRGLSMFLVPLDADGIEIRPIETFGGERTNATFYDDVFVPESLRIGAENEGWAVLSAALNMERASIGGYIGQVRRALDDVVDGLRSHEPTALRSDVVRTRLAYWNARIEAAAALADRVYCQLEAAEDCAVGAAMTKLAVTDTFKDLVHDALDLVGPRSLVVGHGSAAERLEHTFRHAQVSTIYGGTNEIQRNIIAYQGLGLPR